MPLIAADIKDSGEEGIAERRSRKIRLTFSYSAI
jgi:hypothetical protein